MNGQQSAGYIGEADRYIKPLIEMLAQTRVIGGHEMDAVLNMYNNQKGNLASVLYQRYPDGIQVDALKEQLHEFVLYLVKELHNRRPMQNTGWNTPQQPVYNQPYNQPQNRSIWGNQGHQQQQPFSFSNSPTPNNPYIDPNTTPTFATGAPIIQPKIAEIKPMPENVLDSTDISFEKATTIGETTNVTVDRFIQGKHQYAKGTMKFVLGNYKLLRGYNSDREAINATKLVVPMIKTPFLNFIQYKQLVTLSIPLNKTVAIFKDLHEASCMDSGLKVIKATIAVLEGIPAAYSRTLTDFLISEINKVMSYLTSVKAIKLEVSIADLSDLIELINETDIEFLNRVRSIDGYDEVVAAIIKESLKAIISGDNVCDLDTDPTCIGDILHAEGNQHVVDGYTNRDYYLLSSIPEDSPDENKIGLQFENLNDALVSQTVLCVNRLVVHTNMYPEEYRVQKKATLPWGIMKVTNHIDQYMEAAVHQKIPTKLIIEPDSNETIEFNVRKTIEGILRITK